MMVIVIKLAWLSLRVQLSVSAASASRLSESNNDGYTKSGSQAATSAACQHEDSCREPPVGARLSRSCRRLLFCLPPRVPARQPRHTIGFGDLSCHIPCEALTAKPISLLHGAHPPECENREIDRSHFGDSEIVPRKTENRGFFPLLSNYCAPEAKPPGQEVILLEPIFKDGVINNCRWLIAQVLSGCHKPAAEFH